MNSSTDSGVETVQSWFLVGVELKWGEENKIAK